MKENILVTKGLSKKYNNFTALESADITVRKGDIYALIGRNGAGKTTLMKLITGLTAKSGGEFQLFSNKDSDVEGSKHRIGCLIENPAFFEELTVYSNLKYYALQKGISDMKQIDEALEMVNLMEAKNKKFRNLSLGMKQRLGIALAFLDNPDLVILDEPINGLDPIGISELRETFSRLNREKNITFIISSHILSELYLIANRFLFIEKGRIVREITRDELDRECMRCIVIKTNNNKKAAAMLEEILSISDYKVIDDSEIRIYDDSISPAAINSALVKNGLDISALYETGITLEEYFKSLIGGNENA